METNNLKNQFSAGLLGAVSKVLNTEAKDKQEYDYEGDMAMSQLKSIIANSQKMHDMLSDDTNLPEWVQSKITLAEDYISTASTYMQGEMSEETLDEKRGLWDNIHAKQKRIKNGSGERMRKPGSKGAPTAADLKNSQTEEVSLDEKHGGADYAIYHKSYTDAVDHALSHHSKYGLNASDDDRFHHIGLMSKKPSEGNTTTVNLPAKDHTTGKDHTIHMQVYNRGGSHPYELNTYSSKNSTQRNIEKVMAKKKKALGEALIGGQAKLDVDGDGKLEKSDFKKLRNKKIASKMKETKDCSCNDVDEAVYNGHRPTGLPPGQGLPKAQQDALTAKLRDFDAKMDAAKKKFATKEEVELDEGRGRPPKPGSAAYIAQQKAKEAGEAEGPEPDEHIMNQVRKAADSGMTPHKIKYADGSTHALHRVHARAVISKYNRLKPYAKEDMQAEIAKSHEHMMKHAKD